MGYEGGYFLINERLVRGHGPNGHTANDMSQISEYAVEAVNSIQDTPWKINRFVMETVDRFLELGEDVLSPVSGNVVLRLLEPSDPRKDKDHEINHRFPSEEWSAMDRQKKQEFKTKRARVIKSFEEELGVYRATERIINTSRDMQHFDKFYFPHNMDFRTRIYPIPTDLTPQSNDLSKGLLAFARGTRLGEDGVFWMGATVAGHWGEDKLCMDDRYRLANEMLTTSMQVKGVSVGSIQEWVDDPVKNRGWLEADKPFQFLAVAYEWVWAHRMGNPEEWLSFLPGNLDGSCNGAQHLSVMSRDLVGATATNCRSKEATNNQRFDLYQEVADRVWERVQEDIEAGNPLALEWKDKMSDKSARRKVVKRSVMTVPYGVTDYGVADFMIKDKHVNEKAENQWDSAKYMRDLIMDCIDSTLKQGRELQKWFSKCAAICAEAGLPMVWETPSGCKITQAYRNIVQKRIYAFDTRFYIYEEPEEEEDEDGFYERIGMDEKKMATAAPPNVVHSCDAAHLQITVVRMRDAGIRDFSMIHDSFGCPFAHVRLMRDILRQSIVDMYGDNYLLQWKESVERFSGVTLPDPPELGEFDINEILDSEFFFS